MTNQTNTQPDLDPEFLQACVQLDEELRATHPDCNLIGLMDKAKATLKEQQNAQANTIYMQAYGEDGRLRSNSARTSFNIDNDMRIVDSALELVHAHQRGVVIPPTTLWRHVVGTEWTQLQSDAALIFKHQPGEVLGSDFPSWPDDIMTFEERLAYQRGVADARHVARLQVNTEDPEVPITRSLLVAACMDLRRAIHAMDDMDDQVLLNIEAAIGENTGCPARGIPSDAQIGEACVNRGMNRIIAKVRDVANPADPTALDEGVGFQQADHVMELLRAVYRLGWYYCANALPSRSGTLGEEMQAQIGMDHFNHLRDQLIADLFLLVEKRVDGNGLLKRLQETAASRVSTHDMHPDSAVELWVRGHLDTMDTDPVSRTSLRALLRQIDRGAEASALADLYRWLCANATAKWIMDYGNLDQIVLELPVPNTSTGFKNVDEAVRLARSVKENDQ